MIKIYLIILLVFLFIFNKKYNSKKKKNVLVMFSGGLDSTTALYKLLKDTDYNIYVHHVLLKDTTSRWKYENKACHQILTYLKNIRNFNYSQSEFFLPMNSYDKLGGSRDDDNTTIVFIASKIFTVEKYKNIDYIVISNLDCELDNNTKIFMNDMINIMHKYKWSSKKPIIYDPLTPFYNSKCNVYQEVVNNLLQNVKNIAETDKYLDYPNLIKQIICTKKKMYNFIPQYLKNKIIYCRNPKDNKINCGLCLNCILWKNIY